MRRVCCAGVRLSWYYRFCGLVKQVACLRQRVVAVGVADQFVLLQEREGLLIMRGFDPTAQIAQAVVSVDAGFAGCLIDLRFGVFAFEAQ